MAGVVRLPDLYVCEDLSWSKDKVNAALVTLIDTGFIQRCEATKWTWIVKFLEFNPPENPNQKKSLVKIYNQIPDKCEWKSAYLNAHGEVIGLLSNPSATPATPQQPPHETKSTNQQPSQNRSEQSQMTETTLSEPFPNPSATLSKPVTVTGAVIGTVTEEKSLKALVENLEKTNFGELGYDALPDAWGKSVIEDWPELHPDDLQAKWVKFRNYIADFQYVDADGQTIVEDAKGMKTAVYRAKRHQMKLRYGIEVREV